MRPRQASRVRDEYSPFKKMPIGSSHNITDTGSNRLHSATYLVSLLTRVVSRLERWLRVSTGTTLDSVLAVVVADLPTVTGEDTTRRWSVVWGCWISLSCDGSLECPDLVKYFPRDLTNDAAIVDDRFNKLTEGIFIVWDFLRVGGAEAIRRGVNISWKVLNTDVDTLGGGSSGHTNQRTHLL